jgi:hypothetical protein
MFNFLKLKPKRIKRDLMDIETILQSSLKPVSPRPEFIQSLHKGLMEYTFPQEESSEYDLKKTVIFALLGFASIVFVFSLWIRLILVILSTMGMIQSSKREKDANKILRER